MKLLRALQLWYNKTNLIHLTRQELLKLGFKTAAKNSHLLQIPLVYWWLMPIGAVSFTPDGKLIMKGLDKISYAINWQGLMQYAMYPSADRA